MNQDEWNKVNLRMECLRLAVGVAEGERANLSILQRAELYFRFLNGEDGRLLSSETRNLRPTMPPDPLDDPGWKEPTEVAG